jgi:hypothetical protein
MAITVDAASGVVTQTNTATSTNATASHTISASATIIVLFLEAGVSGASDASVAFTVMTLGGSAFTHLASAKKQSGTDGSTAGFVDLYYMTAATLGSALPSGTQTLSITQTYSTGGTEFCGKFVTISYLGALNASPLGTAKTSNGNGVSSLTLTDTLAAGDLIVGCCGNGAATPTVTTGTQDVSSTGGAQTGVHNLEVGHNSGTGSTSLIFGTNSGDFSGATGVKLVADTGAAFIAPRPLVISQAVTTASYW